MSFLSTCLKAQEGTGLYQKRDEWEYTFDTADNNIFLKSKWMAEYEVEYLKEIAKGINQDSKYARDNDSLIQFQRRQNPISAHSH